MWNRVVTLAERVRFGVRRRRVDDETRSELQGHVELLIERYSRLGMTPEDARIAAHRQFGNALLVREEIHNMTSLGWLEQPAADARHAVRLLLNILRMDDLLSSALAAPLVRALLVGLFAALGLTLAAVGVYGVMAYTVSRSTRELAVRLAMGARARELLRMVMRRAGLLAVAGILLGWAGAAAVTQSLETMLYDLSPVDTTTFIAVGILFMTVALLGAYVPARRAMQIDPLLVLRSE